MNGLNALFGPLSKEYCYYFYALSLFGLVSLVLLIISAIVMIASKRRGGAFYVQMLSAAFAYTILYLQNRLLFNMCNV
jgi:uncharacterized membrane protein